MANRSSCGIRSAINGSPQHLMMLFVLRPQVWKVPLSKAVKRSSSGGKDWPQSLSPQHATVPLSRRAQVCAKPLLIAVNCSGGGVACPL